MRQLFNLSLVLGISLILGGLSPALAAGGISGGGGSIAELSSVPIGILGEASPERLRDLRKFINKDLKRELIKQIRNITPEQVDRLTEGLPPGLSSARSLLTDKRELLLEDIRASSYYVMEEPVLLEGSGPKKERDAITLHAPRSPVIFNLVKLGLYDLHLSALQKLLTHLAFHEHVRHFGLRDDRHQLGKLSLRSQSNEALVTNTDSWITFAASDKPILSKKRLILLLAKIYKPYSDKPTLCQTAVGSEVCPGFSERLLPQSNELAVYFRLVASLRHRVHREGEKGVNYGFNLTPKDLVKMRGLSVSQSADRIMTAVFLVNFDPIKTRGIVNEWGYEPRQNLWCVIKRDQRFALRHLFKKYRCSYEIRGDGGTAYFFLKTTSKDDGQSHCTAQDAEWIQSEGRRMLQDGVCRSLDDSILSR